VQRTGLRPAGTRRLGWRGFWSAKESRPSALPLTPADVRFGFDSCGSSKVIKFINKNPRYENMKKYIEPCESSCFSAYVNVNGIYFPCSFAENGDGIDVLNSFDFLSDVWYHSKTIEWRKKLLKNNRNCPIYDV